jgi:hypothetical protein
MSIKRTITIDTLDDLAQFIGERAKEYEDQAARFQKTRDGNPKYMTKASISEARSVAIGLRLAESVVQDTEFS